MNVGVENANSMKVISTTILDDNFDDNTCTRIILTKRRRDVFRVGDGSNSIFPFTNLSATVIDTCVRRENTL